MKKVVALTSGGIDSIALTWILAIRHPELTFLPRYFRSKLSGAYWLREEGTNRAIYELYHERCPNVLEPTYYDGLDIKVSRGRTAYRNQIYLDAVVRQYGDDPDIVGVSMGVCPGQEGGTWVHGWCCSGDTVVATSHGDILISELAVRDLTVDPVYAFCVSDRLEPRADRVIRAGKTGEKQPVFRVLFDDGSHLDVTAEHQVLLLDGVYKAASLLQPGDQVVPYRVEENRWGYPSLKTPRGSVAFHTLISEARLGRTLARKEVVHHKDKNKWNYHPGNLEVMLSAAHTSLHHRGLRCPPRVKERLREVAQSRSPEFWKTCGRVITEEEKQHLSEKLRGRKRPLAEIENVKLGLAQWREENGVQTASQLPEVREKIRATVTRAHERLPNWRRNERFQNHKVVAVFFKGYEDVFDVQTETYHNFYANRICVHNSLAREDHSPVFLEKYLREKKPNWTLWSFQSFLEEDSHIGEKSARVKLGVDVLGVDWLWKTTSCFGTFSGKYPWITLAQGKNKRADRIIVGDRLLALDANGNLVETIVRGVLRKPSRDFLTIRIEDTITMNVTPEHPFYVCDRGWIRADELKIGDELFWVKFINNGKKILSIDRREKEEDVVNFYCEPHNNFFANGILVHNCQLWFTGMKRFSYLGEPQLATGGCGKCHSCVARYVGIRHALGEDLTPYRLDPIKSRWLLQYAVEYRDLPIFLEGLFKQKTANKIKRELKSWLARRLNGGHGS